MIKMVCLLFIICTVLMTNLSVVNSYEKEKFMKIDVLSSLSDVTVSINDVRVLNVTIPKDIIENEAIHEGGLFILVINQFNGELLTFRKFGTHFYLNTIGIAPFIWSISPGRIVIFAVLMEASWNLSSDIRQLFTELGGIESPVLDYSNYLVWVSTIGGLTHLEVLTKDENFKNFLDIHSPPVFASVFVKLRLKDCWNKEADVMELKRRQFCDKYVGYGNLCNCDEPSSFIYHPRTLINSTLTSVPTAIIANSRGSALYRCLITLLTQPGGNPQMILASIDGHNEEIEQLLQLLQIRYILNDMSNGTFNTIGSRIGMHYKFTFQEVFKQFPKALTAIIMEEDILAAPDFYSYMSQTQSILLEDQSLYCISAWSDLSPLHGSRNIHKLYRAESYPSYGWMLSRRIYEEMIPKWPDNKAKYDWDVWLKMQEDRAHLECIIPAVSRSFHYGNAGAHVNNILIHTNMAGHITTTTHDIKLKDLDRLTQIKYEEDLITLLESDKIFYVNTTIHPCDKNFISKDFKEGIALIFIHMNTMQEKGAWFRLAACIGQWSLDVRSHHRGLWRFEYYNTEVIVIAYPVSDYSYLKPAWLQPLRPTAGPKEDSKMSLRTKLNRYFHRVPDLEIMSPNILTDAPKNHVSTKIKIVYY